MNEPKEVLDVLTWHGFTEQDCKNAFLLEDLPPGESYSKDLTCLVDALNKLIALDAQFLFRTETAHSQWHAVKKAAETFAPWLERP